VLARTYDGGAIDTGLLDYAWVLSRHRRTILGIAAVAATLTLVISFLLPTRWTAEAGFIPESSTSIQLPTGINALAGELGFSLPGGDPTSSPDFYAAVTESRSLLEQTLLTRFRVPGAAARDSAALIDILEIQDDDPRKRMEDAVQWMTDHSSAKVDAKTGVITLQAELPDPDLAAAVVSRMVALLNEFNQRTRNLRARERRRFTEGQTADAQRDLTAAEDAMRAFLVRNRSFENSPQLVFENQRLDRQVQIRQDIYQTLRREYEVARIDEVNNTPVLTVVDAPIPPAKPSSPRRVRMTLVALVLGLLVGATYAFVREYVSRSQELQPAAYDRLARSWSRKGAAGAGAKVGTSAP
jgi:uncharacterized protein involved in exopolysaccharide biosynthesis